MNTKTAPYLENPGRAQAGQAAPYVATISPLASPDKFAEQNGLTKVCDVRADLGDGAIVVAMFKSIEGTFCTISGVIATEHDDHGLTRIEDIDFVTVAEALEEAHVALDELFRKDVPALLAVFTERAKAHATV